MKENYNLCTIHRGRPASGETRTAANRRPASPCCLPQGAANVPCRRAGRGRYLFDVPLFLEKIVRKIDFLPELRELQKTIGVDVDLDAGGAGGADAREPFAQYRLEPHFAAGLDEKPLAVAPAQYGERRRCGAEHGNAGELRGGTGECL